MKTLPEKFKTYANVFDEFTMRALFKLSATGLFDELQSAISLGKEANVFSARRTDGSLVAVKIYRLQNCNFNKMWSYLQTDPRFKGMKPRRREIIFAWVQREYRNLVRARECGVRVPTPYKCFHHILVEEFITSEDDVNSPAPMLKNYQGDALDSVREKTYEMVEELYRGGIVHGDLSAFNILVHNDEPIFIDMSQSTDTQDHNALEYLERDLTNISTFFGLTEEEQDAIMKRITKKNS